MNYHQGIYTGNPPKKSWCAEAASHRRNCAVIENPNRATLDSVLSSETYIHGPSTKRGKKMGHSRLRTELGGAERG